MSFYRSILIFCLVLFFSIIENIFCYQFQMGTLQSRLDADFLLAHMCSVKFKEWIVVLATLLRRSEVCLTFVCTGQEDLKLC